MYALHISSIPCIPWPDVHLFTVLTFCQLSHILEFHRDGHSVHRLSHDGNPCRQRKACMKFQLFQVYGHRRTPSPLPCRMAHALSRIYEQRRGFMPAALLSGIFPAFRFTTASVMRYCPRLKSGARCRPRAGSASIRKRYAYTANVCRYPFQYVVSFACIGHDQRAWLFASLCSDSLSPVVLWEKGSIVFTKHI